MIHIIKKYFPIFLIFIGCLYLLSSFFNPLFPRSHDGIYHVIRINEYYNELKSGQFPVRWVNNLDNKYGLPLFNFTYPGPYIISLIPKYFGFDEIFTYKFVMFFAYFIGALGYYFIYQKKNRFFAIIASLIFVLTPYVILDVFVRGALGEVVMMGFIPWVIYGFEKKKNTVSILALFMTIISHSMLGIFFLFFLLCKLIWENNLNLKNIQNILISIGLSSFFLLPLIFENKLITSGYTSNFTFDYRQHFLYPIQLLYGKWDYWYSNPGPVDGMSFQIGFANILLVLVSTFSLFFLKINKTKLFLLFSIVFTLFLTSFYSQFVWEIIFPLQIVQFPWRMIFIPTILFPLIYINLIDGIQKKYLSIIYIFSIALVVLAFVNVRNYRRPMEYIHPEKYDAMYAEESQKTTTSSRQEISPVWSPISKKAGGRIIDLENGQEINLKNNGQAIEFNVENDSNISILINYFPGWKLINLTANQTIATTPDLAGNVVAHVSRGKYVYKYFQTKVELLSNNISLFSLVTLMLVIISNDHKTKTKNRGIQS